MTNEIVYTVKVYPDGSKFWYLNDKLHREDGPAFECFRGKEWYLNGKLHREDGPAVKYPNGIKAWYINDNKLTEQEFLKRTQKAQELTVAEISELLGCVVKIVK